MSTWGQNIGIVLITNRDYSKINTKIEKYCQNKKIIQSHTSKLIFFVFILLSKSLKEKC